MLRRITGSDRGQSLIMLLLLLPVLLGFAGIVIDGAHAFGEKRRTQNAADAAALAAAQNLLGSAPGSCPDGSILITDVRTAAECYSVLNAGPASLQPCNDADPANPTRPAAGTGCYVFPYVDRNGVSHPEQVEVRITRAVQGLLLDAIGLGGIFDNGAYARAVATAQPETGISTSTTVIATSGTTVVTVVPESVSTTITPGSTVTITTPTIWDADYNGDEPHVTANTGCGFPGIEFNNEVLDAPLISRSSVCLRGNAPGGQLLAGGVNGRVMIEGLLGLVTSANRVAAVEGGTTPIAEAQISLGCRIGTTTTSPCTSAQRVYANTIGTSPTNLARPTFNWLAEYNKAAPGPLRPCDPSLLNPGESAGTPPTFDNNTTYNASVSTVDPTPAGSYICRARDANGNIGELSWNAAQKKLTVNGVIFFDAARFTLLGSSQISGPIHYYGKGTIFVASNQQGLFQETWCAGGTLGIDCASPVSSMPNWDPSSNVLWLVLGGGSPAANGGAGPTVGNGSNDIDYKAPSAFQGALYTVNSCHIHGAGAYLSGPLICGLFDTAGLGGSALQFPPVRQLEGGNSTTTVITPGSTVFTTTPGSTSTITTPGSTSTVVTTTTVVTGTTMGLDE